MPAKKKNTVPQKSIAPAFSHVNYLWDEKISATIKGDEVALLVYRSNLLGSDLRITNYGGGNTSVKVQLPDQLTRKKVDVMYVKGSGGDLRTMKKDGLASLYMDRLEALKKIYRGLKYEDEMVEKFNHCIYDLSSKAPSIDTPLHAFLPFKHIDHLHPDAAIAIAACKDGKKINQQLFGGTIGWIDWQRPGFDLALKLEALVKKNRKLRGILLGGHGLFTWGNTSHECYLNSLEVIEKYSEYLAQHAGKTKPVFGGQKIFLITAEKKKQQVAAIAPLLRGLCSENSRMVGHFSDDARVLEFVNSNDLEKLAALGTSCPDHFLRTKIRPLVLRVKPDEAPDRARLSAQFDDYRKMYADYYKKHKHPDSPAMRDANPVVILYPGIGMFTFGKDKQTARISAEFYTNAINVIRGAEAVSKYVALPAQEAFNIEYWKLEEAKLQRMPKPKPLSGKVALVTGGGGGIGKAVAKKFIENGACAVICDNDKVLFERVRQEFELQFGKDAFTTEQMDVTSESQVKAAMANACIAFGGVDIVVNSAGLSISKPVDETTEQDWELLYEVLVKGQFLVCKQAAAIMRAQAKGGDLINIASKNALVSGPNNAGYGSAKAAQLHMSRLLAAELGKDQIRVNVVNPDAVIAGSKIWQGAWAEGRARAYGIKAEELPAFYAKRTLLNAVILPEDIASACLAFVNGTLSKTTGNMLNVDGGLPEAFPR